MSKIIIDRKSSWLNRSQGFTVLIDGETAGTIANARLMEFEVTTGLHRVQLKTSWCYSPELEVEVKEGKSVALQVTLFPYADVLFLLALFGILARVGIDLAHIEVLQPLSDWIMVLALPYALALGYYLSTGRKNYLRLNRL